METPRNPDNEPGVWCYTVAGPWAFCSVPRCTGRFLFTYNLLSEVLNLLLKKKSQEVEGKNETQKTPVLCTSL